MVYFPTSPKQCFCTTLQSRQTQKLHLFTQYDYGRSVENGHCWAFFVEPGIKSTANIIVMVFYRSKCYLLSDVAGDNFIFQQDSVRAHRARDTIELLQRETPDFISPELCPPTDQT